MTLPFHRILQVASAGVFLGGVLLAFGASAQTQVTPEMRAKAYKVARVCKPDIQQYCKGIEYGGGRIAMCLKEHETSLSDSCRTALTEVSMQ
ncbi:cysteine rich repeat-containing protein [Rhizobium cremeum]|uniref:cysteine rich repeat-containing protein n=1 Tax=Rhizobium cremeum TaxID=2813827 RepID=UPI000DE336C7